jgi:dipeptidase D
MTKIHEMEPQAIWRHFAEICKLPRPSQHEEAICRYIINFAQKHKLSYNQDQAGNIIVRKAGSRGKEKAAITVLQAHLDMVGEKDEGMQHDFGKDPLNVVQEGDYVHAVGTTLGADNGIGVATALAILESKNLVHGPLEALFTVDEETGLNGARGLSRDFIEGRRMINLDSEEDGIIYIGCAGGGGTDLQFPLFWQDRPANTACLEITVRGLLGGHSGGDIHLGRGNAIEILVRILDTLAVSYRFHLHLLDGGDKHNAIPRLAKTKLAIAGEAQEKFLKAARLLAENVKGELGKKDPNMQLAGEETASFAQVLTADCQRRLLCMIKALPHGVLAMNPDIPDLVNTSTNLARVEFKENVCHVQESSRSSINEALEATRYKVAAVGALAGAGVKHDEAYPGWKPALESPILQHTREAYRQEYKAEPKVMAIHAGLECGIIGEKISGMDMVSIGPQMDNVHTPKERVQISSVARFWKVMEILLQRLAN